MPKISIATYQIMVRERMTREYEYLDDIDGDDFYDFLKEYIDQQPTVPVRDDDDKKAMRFVDDRRRGRYISGLIECGEYGRKMDVLNVFTGNREHEQDVDEAGMPPYYFLFYVPTGQERAYLVIQKYGKSSPFTVLKNDLRDKFQVAFPDYMIDVDSCLPIEILQTLMRGGSVTEIEFLRPTIPTDIADTMRVGPEIASYHAKIVAKNGLGDRLKNSIMTFLRQRREISEFIGIRELGFSDAVVNLKTATGGNKKVRVSKLSYDPSIDVTDEVTIRDGSPTFESIDRSARDWLHQILN